jgi:hypothetical protein
MENTLKALDVGAVKDLIIWDNLNVNRCLEEFQDIRRDCRASHQETRGQ